MKAFFQLFCLVLICSVAITGNCSESYRAHFEVDVEDGTGKAGITGPCDVVSGTPLTFDIGQKTLSLLFSVASPPLDVYSLTVSLSPKAKSTHNLTTPLLTQTFHSGLVGGKNGPLEFEVGQNGFRVSGVVALSSVR